MSEKVSPHLSATMTAEVRVPFRYKIVHGTDPSLKSAEQRATTRSVNLVGLTFETVSMNLDGFHLSFTESSFGRNSLEISLDLGKKLGEIEVLGQVDYYERRSTTEGHCFIVAVGFIDVQADELAVLREFLNQVHGLSR
ncbi:MAG: hypothetical protein RDU20_15620 [Desulfomonilaceae bacterium]|nr:hypothetical protein [Desulfomonilaceae bacterium]